MHLEEKLDLIKKCEIPKTTASSVQNDSNALRWAALVILNYMLDQSYITFKIQKSFLFKCIISITSKGLGITRPQGGGPLVLKGQGRAH